MLSILSALAIAASLMLAGATDVYAADGSAPSDASPLKVTAIDFSDTGWGDGTMIESGGECLLMDTFMPDCADALKRFLEENGYKKFGDENYWPIRVNEMDLRSELGAVRTRSRTVSNKGFTNALKPNANQSVSIGSIFDTFTEHVAEMANYSAFLDTMEDLKRIYNYTERGEGGAIDLSIKYDINNVFGNKGTKYFEKLMEDVSNGMISEQSYFGGLIGRFKAAAVGSNLRVIIQQPTAIFRAMDMISPKYMAIGIAKFRQGAKKALENSPIAQWKDWGYFDINTGRSTKNILFENSNALDRVQSVLMAGAGKADSLAWGALYSAVEAEIKDTRPDLDPRSKEFDRVVADRFADVIDHSQVVDGVLQRSGIMRSTNAIDKMATSFMGEPIKQFNMLATAIYDLRNASPETKKQAARTLGRSVAALAAALAPSCFLPILRKSMYLACTLSCACGVPSLPSHWSIFTLP